MLKFILPNGENVDVPKDVVGAEDGAAAVQGFYDGQAQRVALELGITVPQLLSKEYAADPAGFVKANAVVAAPPVAAPAPQTPAAPDAPAAPAGGNS